MDEAVRAGRLPQHRASAIRLTRTTSAPIAVTSCSPPGCSSDALAGGLLPPEVTTRGLPLTIWLMRGCGLRISEALAVRG